MNVINFSGDEHVLRIKSALLQLSQVLQAQRYAGTQVYRLAVARRFTVCYFAFLNYLVARVRLYEDARQDLGMQDIVQRCRRSKLFDASDERMAIQMSMLYATLTYYNEGFDALSDDLIADIPRMLSFLERFIALHDIVPVQTPLLEATL